MKTKLQSDKALRFLLFALISGLGGILLFSLQAWDPKIIVSILSVGIMVAGAALLLSVLLGFLFGIPRTLQQEQKGGGDASAENNKALEHQVNTNLVQISDWLTKMLVGVGLTQLAFVPGHLWTMSANLKEALGNFPSSQVFALAIIIFFSGVGFLYGYLWTRLVLAGAIREADLASIGILKKKVDETNLRIQRVQDQSTHDSNALNLVHRQLNPGPEIPVPSQEKLNEVVAKASQPIKVQIFNQIQKVRTATWRTDQKKMALTIPIFRALIHADSEDKYHRNHAQLGYALKDKKNPDFVTAKKSLSKAIELRDRMELEGWELYEFNRAMSTIKSDEKFKKNLPSIAAVQDEVIADLKVVNRRPDLKKLIKDTKEIADWIKLNDVKPGELKA